MYIIEIIVPFTSQTNLEEVENVLSYMVSSLRQNGQSYGKTYPMAVSKSKISIRMLCPEKSSLDLKNANKYVKGHWEDLEKLIHNKLIINELGVELAFINDNSVCDCKKIPFQILYTNYLHIGSPIRCGKCFKHIPLYKIPPTKDEDYNDIMSWESNYVACDTLQMNCEVGERFGLREMSNLNSHLSQQGIRICQKIEELTQRSTYYYLYNYRKIRDKGEENRACPSCGEEWKLKKTLHQIFDYQCKRCRLLSNISPNQS